MTFKLGLTGSIGMGKSTTAKLFAEEGCAVWDADAAVHRLYSPGGAAVSPLAAAFPDAIIDGAVSRDRLKEIISNDPSALARIEAIVHPLVAADRRDFLANTTAEIAVLDIPLLLENDAAHGLVRRCDALVYVDVDPETRDLRAQRTRGWEPGEVARREAAQIPPEEKRDRADHVIPNHGSQEELEQAVAEARQRIGLA